MNDFRFIKYEPTPKATYMGIMTVEIRGVLLRYKIVKTKDGSALFPAAASYKMSVEDEDARYQIAFSLDSNSEQELLFDFIKEKMCQILAKEAHKLNTVEDLMDNKMNRPSSSNSQPSRSNAEIEASDDLPF